MKVSIFSGYKLRISLHVFAWLILFILPAYFLFIGSGIDKFFYVTFYSQTLSYALIFYLNYFFLLPNFFFRKKKILYFVTAAILVFGLFYLLEEFNHYFLFDEQNRFGEVVKQVLQENKIPKPPKNWHVFNFIFTSFLISGFAMGLRFYDKLSENEKEKKESERERLNSELALLKNQVSPHFFFNTLNNIYSLVEINTEDAQKSILQLSKLMRYLLYESEHGNTQLSREIDFMKNYIQLMRLRVNNKVNLIVDFPEQFSDVSIPPLLFISFIENAFKHGISYRDKSFIEIRLKTGGAKIEFECVNSINAHREESIVTGSGIGLENVKKRLALLFPQSHNLMITEDKDTYKVHLIIYAIPKATL